MKPRKAYMLNPLLKKVIDDVMQEKTQEEIAREIGTSQQKISELQRMLFGYIGGKKGFRMWYFVEQKPTLSGFLESKLNVDKRTIRDYYKKLVTWGKPIKCFGFNYSNHPDMPLYYKSDDRRKAYNLLIKTIPLDTEKLQKEAKTLLGMQKRNT